ncbi:hypothetical protein ACM64Y_07080 [Novispirillum sp. DQ9]|uniref:hypothetical protein n=1 Tax=Novispirillum sp. DQ9 TaxID=3398612 RepID=UPI003C7D1963
MSLRLHHVFCFTEPDPPPLAGLIESFRRAHPGQGTTNLCHVFGDAYLELLWEVDRAEITAPALARTGLAERARWRDTGACPFGLCLTAPPAGAAPPFAAWDYEPPFLPPGMGIPVATLSDDVRQPFVFLPPVPGQPAESWQPGLGRIVGLRLEFPPGVAPAPELVALAAAGVLEIAGGERWRMVLSIAATDGGLRRLALPDGTWIG